MASYRKKGSRKGSRKGSKKGSRKGSRKVYRNGCNVKTSPTDKKEDLIKELRAYVACWEKKTERNQDLPMARLKSESVAQIKKHLSFYRKNNINNFI